MSKTAKPTEPAAAASPAKPAKARAAAKSSDRSGIEFTPPSDVEAPTAPAPGRKAAEQTKISVSRGFSGWLGAQRCSLAFTSYQTGKLFLVGRMPDGKVSFHQQNYQRAMGVHAQKDRLYVGSLFQIWRLENALAPNERANQHHDRLYVPRNAQTVGDVDVHEVSVDRAGRIIFVNTKYSCLATTSTRFGFRPIWKPMFISKLAAEDRCHMNGLAMEDGLPRYVTAVSQSDVLNGWRERRHEGGVLIDVQNDRIVTDQLSMPHSPRVVGKQIYALDSGRGWIIRIDPQTGAKEDIAFCPGFLRGMTVHNGFAIVTVSLPRDGAFKGLELDAALKKRDGEPWCGVLIVNLSSGDIVEFIRLDGQVKELFDVAVIPETLLPMAIGANSPEMHSFITYDKQFAPLIPPAAARPAAA
ncbi:TIGR03032 family protein [Caulobacter sp. 17J65-9]|uniref:TIGR03032 family protein n=1 Tax=Caulobacter sp. 17J65-9 TaxID=2709382 RepID=UPI0013CD0B3A|nr:TIGR03032 family protein [Caulobacter sp. 17J65-9]NEX93027.1 TIGR03032 family protein [Caulobacter sp. 17J65-9]